jgi:hypothetical protein
VAYLQAREGTLSAQNERAALATAAAVCAVALSQWPGTLADDEALLAGASGAPPLSDDVRLAVSFRAGKKRALAEAISGLKARMQATVAGTAGAAGAAGVAGAAAPPPGGAAKPRGFGTRAKSP